VISHAVWQTRFGGDPQIIGRVATLNGRPHEIIGVTSPDFQDPFTNTASAVWLPITSAPSMAWFDRGNANVWAVGRVKAGASVDAARKDVAAIAAALAAELPTTNAGFDVRLIPLKEYIVGSIQPVLLTVLAFVAVVLLIACANVANLQLARAASRARELSVRAALGAARSRLMRQLLTESLVLALAGGVAGVVGAHWAIKALVAAVPGGLPVYGDVGLDRGVLAFSLAITLGAGLLFGAVPALHAARANLHDALTTRSGEGAIGGRLDVRNAFVAVQLALCIVLLVGASLLSRSLVSLQHVDPGFDTRNMLTAEFRLPAAKYRDPAQVRDFLARAVAEIRAVPGVRSAALVGSVPLSGNWGQAPYVPVGQPDPAPGTAPVAITNYVTDGYFRTMGIPLIAGREFDDRDRADAEQVVIVNEELAKRAWPGEPALGKRLRIVAQPEQVATVVGVARSVKHIRLTDLPGAQLYTPVAQTAGIFASIVARTDGDPAALVKTVRGAVWKVDADQPVWRLRSMESIYAQTTATPRFTMLLTGAFALLALLLAAVGVYGVMTFAVAQRTREVGIRMALGAQRGEVVRLVLVRGARVVGVATVVGLVAAFAAAQLIRKQLFGVGTADPLTYLAVPAVLAAVALVACWLPARRAASVDPLIALRGD
jgi:putative ABC transport system permease protein